MKSLLIYYGYLNSYDSANNSWDNEKVSMSLAKFNMLVFGDGIQLSSHGDYSNTQIIIPRINALNPNSNIFGYVTAAQSFANFKSKVDDWDTLGVHGIFFDEAGYDYGTTSTNSREEFNKKVDYVHSLGLGCFINAWKPEHVLSNDTSDDDTSYPNSTWNASMLESNLDINDWYLLESFAIDSNKNFESKTQWLARGEKAKEFAINIAACSVIADSDSNGLDKMKFIYVSALMHDLDAVGSSDDNYGASSAKSKHWLRPIVSFEYDICANDLVQCSGDTDVYRKYYEHGYLEIDFSSGSEDSTIVDYLNG